MSSSPAPTSTTISVQPDSNTKFEIHPLPEQEYVSFEVAESALHSWNKEEGIDVTRAHNKKNKLKVIRQRDYQCDRCGKTQNTSGLREENRVRTARGTSKTGCSMKISLEAVDPNACEGKWKIVHLKGSLVHNHPASRDPSIHPGNRRRDMERHLSATISSSDLVASQSAVGVSPQVVLATLLHADPSTTVTAKDIANRKNTERQQELSDDTPMGVLLKKLKDNIFFFQI